MMNKAGGYILFMFILSVTLASPVCAADADKVIIERPVMEYKSGRFRDPFKTYLIKEEPKPVEEQIPEVIKPKFESDKLTIQGIVWGVERPQVIINNRVCTIGDTVEGAQILSIDKKGVTLNFYGEIVNLYSPGQGPTGKEMKKQGGTK